MSCWDAYANAESHDGTDHQRGDGVGVCTVIYVAETMEQADKDVRLPLMVTMSILAAQGQREAGLEKPILMMMLTQPMKI